MTAAPFLERFRSVDAWRSALGLLPVPLTDGPPSKSQFVLLNGSSGNFCLDFEGTLDRRSRCSTAWSCNVGHYVTYTGDRIVVNRWDREAAEETFPAKGVLEKLNDFQRHLERSRPDFSLSIIKHVLRVFRQLRSVLNDELGGHRSLRVLLHLLASAAANERRLSSNLNSWGLNDDLLNASADISDATWDRLAMDLLGVGRYDVLEPNIGLLLRHAAGPLFQEAHLEASATSTLWIPGLEQPATVRSDATAQATGIYFTPPAVARTLAEEAIAALGPELPSTITLFDPACGSGELVKESLRLLRVAGYKGSVRIIAWDVSPMSVDVTRFVLGCEVRWWSPGTVELSVRECDSLTAQSWPQNVDLVIMNPPFLAWQKMSLGQRARVLELLPADTTSKPNLALVFASRAVTSLSVAGVLAMIAPTSLFEARSAGAVRAQMGRALAPILVARLGNQGIFSQATVDAAIYVGRGGSHLDVAATVLWADSRPYSVDRALRALRKWHGKGVDPVDGPGFSVYKRRAFGDGRSPWLARSFTSWMTYERIRAGGRALPASKVFEMHQGVRLGSDVFIVERQYFKSLPKAEKRLFRPAVMNSSIVDGKLSDGYYVFYPYGGGIVAIEDEAELAGRVPTYFEQRLKAAEPSLSRRKTLASSSGLHWWDLLRSRGWQEERAARIVCKYFGDVRPFAFDEHGDYVVVVGNAWSFQKGAISIDVPAEDAYQAMLSFLDSSVGTALLEYVSVQVAGGQWDLSAKYLHALLVPDLTKVRADCLQELVRVGKSIGQGEPEPDWRIVDQIVLDAFYG